jgi:hypothetical protein
MLDSQTGMSKTGMLNSTTGLLNAKTGVLAGALLVMAAIVPAAAQSPAPSPAPSPGARGQSLPDETIAKAGAALRQVAAIQNVYEPKLEAAGTPDERARVGNEEMDAAKKAVSEQGLTVDEYNNVMRMAQADPALGERLKRAATSGH